ncbi:16S rRNA (guanine(966)-N(2))-methyltransferase RsmD [Arenimonas sp. MALMAid1274]|uniref:16S rRNA (guanine(966)-N(2))-methyltransferase RsmD n=1 Tax=Arenimonas sp. MALMAid1274 TaxID=3411630 RepID=UPI003B9F57A3
MNQRPPGVVRIIAGHLRGSKLPVADRPGLRPSTDRVRETLFNWLQGVTPGARVLDLFAGTGALGFEAASRGAGQVLLVEKDSGLAESLRATAARLKVANLQVQQADALAWLRGPAKPRFDLVFLDPPFDAGLWEPAAAALAPWLAPGALIYVETPVNATPTLPAHWLPHRQAQTRELRYALFRAPPSQVPESAAIVMGEPNPQGKPSA